MRRFLLVLTSIFILIPLWAFAASEFESDEKIAAGVIGTAGTGATYEISPSKIFSLDKNFGKNLYEFVYKRTKHEGSDLAIKRTLAKRPLSKEELLLLIPGASIGDVLAQGAREKLAPQEVARRRLEYQAELAEEKELADIEVLSKMEIEPTELFSNGDESDSGFDLLVDLDIIDAILFGKTETVLGGAGPGAPAGSNVAAIGSGAGAGGAAAQGNVPGAFQPVGFGAGGAGFAAGSQMFEEPSVLCPVNQAFNDAVSAVRAAEKQRGGGAGGAGSAGAGQGAGASGPAGEGEEGLEDQSIMPEQPANWSKPLPCTKTFCLKTEAVYKKESAYLVNDNCIACHFEKINDAFKKTFQHSLVPSKATGNLMEAPKCKSSSFNLKWNFILVSQPILTPPNDDLVIKGDFTKNLIDFYEKYYDNPGRCDKLKATIKNARNETEIVKRLKTVGGACKPDSDQSAKAAENLFNQATPETDQNQIMLNIKKQVEAKKQEAVKIMEEIRLKSEAQNQSEQFKVLMQELDAMNGYFEGFSQLYRQLVSDEKDAPCKVLINKETCP